MARSCCFLSPFDPLNGESHRLCENHADHPFSPRGRGSGDAKTDAGHFLAVDFFKEDFFPVNIYRSHRDESVILIRRFKKLPRSELWR